MKTAWTMLAISALTDFIITATASIGSAMTANGSTDIPSMGVLIVAGLAGLLAAARTVQAAIKAEAELQHATGVAPRQRLL